MNDPNLDELLRSAGNKIPLPPSFKRSVWMRIEIASARHLSFESLFAPLTRQFAAVSVILAMTILGLGLGAGIASHPEDLKEAYVKSVSPFASAHVK